MCCRALLLGIFLMSFSKVKLEDCGIIEQEEIDLNKVADWANNLPALKKQDEQNWGSFFEVAVLEFTEQFLFRSEKFHKMQAKDKAEREANSPMLNCVLKYDHFENIHRYIKLN